MKIHTIITMLAVAASCMIGNELFAQAKTPVGIDPVDNQINVNPANPKNYPKDTVVGIPKTDEPALAPKPNNTPSPAPTNIPSAPPSSVPTSPNTVPSTTPSGSPNTVGTPKR